MNLPNKLTLLRIICVIPFISLLSLSLSEGDLFSGNKNIYFLTSGGIFAFAMITDFIDGYLARKNNQITLFGKLFDPLADKFITTTAMIFLSLEGIIPIYITLFFILRDILVDGSRNVAAKNNVEIAASWIGKWKTMILSIGILLIFFSVPFINIDLDFIMPGWKTWLLILPILIASILSIASGYKYFMAILPIINLK